MNNLSNLNGTDPDENLSSDNLNLEKSPIICPSLSSDNLQENLNTLNKNINHLNNPEITSDKISKILNIEPEAFYGRINHRKILDKLLNDIEPVNFRDYLELPE